MCRSRKPVGLSGSRGFESLPLRQTCVCGRALRVAAWFCGVPARVCIDVGRDPCGHTSSKKDSATYSPSKDNKGEAPSTGGCHGQDDHNSNRSSTSPKGSRNTAQRSKRTSITASPKDSSNPRTPRSGSSPESHSASTAPNPSSPSQCSPSAATHHTYPAEPDPHIQQESAICARRGARCVR
jgi:hypothetical protein